MSVITSLQIGQNKIQVNEGNTPTITDITNQFTTTDNMNFNLNSEMTENCIINITGHGNETSNTVCVLLSLKNNNVVRAVSTVGLAGRSMCIELGLHKGEKVRFIFQNSLPKDYTVNKIVYS